MAVIPTWAGKVMDVINGFVHGSGNERNRQAPQVPSQEDYYASDEGNLYMKQSPEAAPQSTPYANGGYQAAADYGYQPDMYGGQQQPYQSAPQQPYQNAQQGYANNMGGAAQNAPPYDNAYAYQGEGQRPPMKQDNVSFFPGMEAGSAPQAGFSVHAVQMYSYKDFHALIPVMTQGNVLLINCEAISNKADVTRCIDLIFGAAYALNCHMKQLSSWKNGGAPVYIVCPANVPFAMDVATEQLNGRGTDSQRRAKQTAAYAEQQPNNYGYSAYKQRSSYEQQGYEEDMQAYEEPQDRYRRPMYRASPD